MYSHGICESVKKTEKTGLALGDITSMMITQRRKEEMAARRWFPASVDSPQRAKMTNSSRPGRRKELALGSSTQEHKDETSQIVVGENQTEDQSL